MVYVLELFTSNEGTKQLVLDTSLGFSAGVMIAASFWSLLAPSIEVAEELGYGSMSWVPAAVGFLLGGGGMLLPRNFCQIA